MRLSLCALLMAASVVSVQAFGLDEQTLLAIARNDRIGVDEAETAALQGAHGMAYRRGKTLFVTLSRGKKKAFADYDATCEKDPNNCHRYRLSAVLPRRHAYLLSESYYEGCPDYLLVDDRSGRSVKLGAVPVFSPDGQRVLVQNECVADGHDNHFEVWVRKGTGWRREWAYTDRQAYDADPKLQAPYHTDVVSWHGDTIDLRFETQMEEPQRQWVGRIVRTRGGWELAMP